MFWVRKEGRKITLSCMRLNISWGFPVSFNCLWLGVRSQEVQQSPQSLINQEGEDVIITCKSSETLYSLQWYLQKHGEGPILLMILRSGGEHKSHGKIVATINEKKQQSSLYITASQPSHSGTYFCGAETQWYTDLQQLYSNLKLGDRCSPSTRPEEILTRWLMHEKKQNLKKIQLF